MYRVEANTIVTFQHVFIKFDSVRLQYDQLNTIMTGSYIYPFYNFIYFINEAKQLILRMTNPYYLLVDY